MPSNKIDDYEVLNIIGTGSYGTCMKIRRRSDGKIRVWKELDYGTMSDSEKQLLVSEVNLLRELKHENIVRYHDRIIDKATTKIYIIMEYCEGGDLAAYISKHKKERKFVDETFVWKVLYQISSALKECHLCSRAGSTVMHRDLKPANVFLDVQKNCKLGDFGLARVLNHDTSFAKTFVGTPYYMSPELVNRSSYNEKSDIWSLGCLIYELCALVPPFLAANQKLLGLKIQEGHFKPIPSHYSKELQRIIERMLTVVETRRPSIQDILNSQHVQKHVTVKVDRLGNDQEMSSAGMAYRKVESLKAREKKLDEREKELDRRERALTERERLFEERMDRKFPSQKRVALDLFTDKENNFPLYPKKEYGHFKEERHDRALRFLDQNPILGRYESRVKPSFTGFR